jgi:hypothetical protein
VRGSRTSNIVLQLKRERKMKKKKKRLYLQVILSSYQGYYWDLKALMTDQLLKSGMTVFGVVATFRL